MTIRIPMLEQLAAACPRCGALPGKPCVARRAFACNAMATLHRERREAAIDAKRRRGEPTGDCYEAAGRFMLDAWLTGEGDRLTLVHGIVSGQGPLEGQRIGHAWIEINRGAGDGGSLMVRDVSNGRDLVLPQSVYYGVGRIRSDECRYYSMDEARALTVANETWGPWEESS